MQLVLLYLQPLRRNSVLKCALHPKIAKNSLKTSFFEGFKVVQGHRCSWIQKACHQCLLW